MMVEVNTESGSYYYSGSLGRAIQMMFCTTSVSVTDTTCGHTFYSVAAAVIVVLVRATGWCLQKRQRKAMLSWRAGYTW